ncbi:hypothetical protein [Streptomyces sp. NPDC004266]|uniref:hypothetical protein n=1 Tax=Streptomyces sp. NPDC004266 TaxID=3364693 RepID=UPI00369C1EC1
MNKTAFAASSPSAFRRALLVPEPATLDVPHELVEHVVRDLEEAADTAARLREAITARGVLHASDAPGGT